MQKRSHILEIDIMRALAILGVLLTHATSIPTAYLAGHSVAYPIYLTLNRFGKLGTPTFIFLSSMVLFYSYYQHELSKRRLGNFYKNRLTFILLPYLLWSVIYYLLLLTNGYNNLDLIATFDWAKFKSDLLFGKAYPHLYFVFISIQFYLLFPILLIVLKKYKKVVTYIFLIGFLTQWAWVFYNYYVLRYPYKGSIFLSYMSYYTLGALVGIYFESIKQWLLQTRLKILGWSIGMGSISLLLWLGLGAWHVHLFYNLFVHKVQLDSRWYELAWNLYTLSAALFLFFVARAILQSRATWLATILTKLGMVSFGIYLIHPAVLYYWRRVSLGTEPWQYHAHIILGYFTALLLSWIVVVIVERLPLSWIIFGQKREQKKVGQKAVI